MAINNACPQTQNKIGDRYILQLIRLHNIFIKIDTSNMDIKIYLPIQSLLHFSSPHALRYRSLIFIAWYKISILQKKMEGSIKFKKINWRENIRLSIILIPRRLSSHQHPEHMEDPVTHFHRIVQTLSSVDSHQTL